MSDMSLPLEERTPRRSAVGPGAVLGLVGAFCFGLHAVDGRAMAVEEPAKRAGHAERPTVDIRVIERAGSIGLAVDPAEPVGHDLRRRGDYVVLTFERPVHIDVDALVAAAGDALIGAVADDDGRRLILMTRMEADLQGDGGASEARMPDIAGSAAGPRISPASLERPEVEIRAGEHAGFSRLVFDWPSPIGHDVRRDGDRITIIFDRPGRMDLSSLVARSGGRVVDAVVEDMGRRVVLTTRGLPDLEVRDYEPDLLVLDLTGAAVAASADDAGAFDDELAEAGPASAAPAAGPSDRRNDVPAAQAAAGGGLPGQFEVDEDALDRALERTLTREGVLLLPAGKVEVTPSFAYRRRESRAPTQVDLFGLFAQVRETEIRRDEFEAGLAVDVGLPFDSQLEISQSYRHIDQTTMTSAGFVGLGESDESADVFDDLVIGLAKGLVHENGWWPDLVARITWDSDTGDDRDGNIGLGGGSHELTGSLSFLKTRDPLAFFGSVSYGHSFEEDGFDPGNQIGVALGTTLAAGPDTSLRLALSQSFTGKAEIDDVTVPGSKETSASLTAGASMVLGRGVLLDTSVTAGLTDDAPDYAARVALPVRFDPF